MAATHTFPQSGDDDYAENFTQLGGSAGTTGFVRSGMSISLNETPSPSEITITSGLCYIRLSSITISDISEDRLNPTIPVQIDQNTIQVDTDSGLNHVYVEPDIGTDDNASFAAYSSTGSAGANALKIGEVDTGPDPGEVDEQFNRAPVQVTKRVEYKRGQDAQFSHEYDKSSDSLLVRDEDGDSDLFQYNKSGAHQSYSDLNFPNVTGTPSFTSHDHSESGLTSIPNSGLSNSDVTVTAGDGLKNGGSVALGSAVQLDVEPADFAGSYLSDDGSDNLQANLGHGLEGDGADNIRLASSAVGSGLVGGSGTDLAHADTSSQSDVTAADGAAVTDLTFDGFGHVTGATTTDFDTRFLNSDDANRIDVQSTAPSSPSTNDIWVDTS